MKLNYLKLTCVLALLGVAATASAQTSLLVGWTGYNSSSTTFPYAPSTLTAPVSSAVMNSSGLFALNDSPENRGLWGAGNNSTTLDTTTAPYLSWTINLTDGATITDAILFVNLARVSCTLSLRSSLDNYATSLVDLSSANSLLENYMIPVGTLNESVTYRLFVYDVATGYPTTSVAVGDAGCNAGLTTLGGTYNSEMDGDSTGLLGDVSAVPEPSTVALSVVCGLGLVFFRRRK
jgi:hypothetical protein